MSHAMIRPDLSEPHHVDTRGTGADVFVFPTSFAQRRLWFLDRLIPDSYVYNLPTAYRITGRLNMSVLEETFSKIVSRHESLRTTFDAENGEPVQIISNPKPVRLPVIDLRSLEMGEREKQVRQLIKEELEYKFDLARGPLLRVILLKTADEEHVLVKNMHHIISDSWSEDILLREWLSLYETLSQNKPPALAPPAIQYADYTEWQKQTLQGEELERQINYWKKKLGGEMTTLLLPTDRPRPAGIDFSGASAGFTLNKATAEALKLLSREQDVTLFITLLTAFKVLLHRYTSQTDIVVGVPITNRNRSELENLIGFFLNTLVLRTEFQGSLGFREILWRVREVTLGAFEHQDLPFEVLVEKLQPERDFTQHPLCQVMFVLLREEARVWKSDGLTIEPVKIEQTTAKFDLMLQMVEKENAIEGTFIYSTALFDRETIDRMVGHFQILLEGIVADPARSVDELPLLSEQERKQILIEWNKTQAPRSMTPLHELVAAQCERTPDATAVIFEGAQLSYRELNNRANHLAHELQRRGVGPETLVAICAERSLEMVIGLLAVLKAGGTYVPLDPSYPQERLAFMLSDAKAPVLLTQSHLSSRLPQHSANVIFLDQFEGETDKNPVSGVNAENLAYMIYTSGSTGKPKGAMNTHRGICNRLLWMQDAYGLTGMDSVLQKTPFTFDVSVWEFFWPLMFGARLVMARPGLHGDSGYLINTICEKKITTLHFVPPMLSAFLTDKSAGKCVSLKRVICSGEALAVETQQQFFAVLSGTELHNLYGPTEAAVDVTFWKCERDFSGSTVPIGRPVANTQIYLLNSALQPMPVGVAGELHIGGVQLARGYLARPELTVEKFIPNPFGEGRLYKTGDLARYRKDGAIEFLGRMDHQVKVRGFRIELAEIESALDRHPAVQQCVVIAREDRLVAYIVKRGETEEGDLRVFLKSELPDYMIPSAFVFLDGLPLTPNGKVDRKALPSLERSLSRQHEFVEPRTDLEKKLAEIWSHVLGVEHIGIHDDFFELGGHSLMAVSLFTEIEQKLGRKLPLATLFQATTLEQIAGVIQREGWTAPWSPLVAIQPLGGREPFFCIHGADGAVLFYSKMASLFAPDQPVYGLQAQGLDGGHIVYSSMEAMASLYIKEIRTVQQKGPYFLGGYSFGGLLALEMAIQLRAQGELVAMVALLDANNPAVPPRRYTLRERIVLRTRVIAGLSLKQKVAFVLDRGWRKLKVIILLKKEALKIRVYKSKSKHKEIVPVNYRIVHVREANNAAAHNYQPRVYNGALTLIRAENPNDGFEFDSKLGWGGLAKDGIEIHDVPGQHETIFREPHVHVLAETLKKCIEKARLRFGL